VYRRAAAEGRGVIVFEGEMVDEPMVVRAEAVLARADGMEDGNAGERG
jgi:citrate lyase beta subunit